MLMKDFSPVQLCAGRHIGFLKIRIFNHFLESAQSGEKFCLQGNVANEITHARQIFCQSVQGFWSSGTRNLQLSIGFPGRYCNTMSIDMLYCNTSKNCRPMYYFRLFCYFLTMSSDALQVYLNSQPTLMVRISIIVIIICYTVNMYRVAQ